MNKLLIIGGGGHARSCIDVVESERKYKIVGIVDRKSSLLNQKKTIYPIIGSDGDLKKIHKICNNAIIAIGQIKSPKKRIDLYELLQNLNYNLPVIVSPNSYVSSRSEIEEGSIIMHQVIINSNSKIGKNCIINNKSLIEHDVKIDNFCHIAPGAILNGGVQVGKGTFIGSGAIIRESVKIGKNCVIGSGAVVKKDILRNTTVI